MNKDFMRLYTVVKQYGFQAEYTAQSPLLESLLADPAPQVRNTFPNPVQYNWMHNGDDAIGHDDINDEKTSKDVKWQFILRHLSEGLIFLLLFVFSFRIHNLDFKITYILDMQKIKTVNKLEKIFKELTLISNNSAV